VTVTLCDLFAFGNTKRPRPPRVNKDIFPDDLGMLRPGDAKDACGASLVGDPQQAFVAGPYYRLPAGTVLPDGLGLIADGSDVDPDSQHGPTHHTLFPAKAMSAVDFVALFLQLPWQPGGKK
jgi:hypothetical protein